MTPNSLVTDLSRGIYRRQYSGFIQGRRICSVSLEAEAWFWRINGAVDDFGNLSGEATLLYAATAGRRSIEVVRVGQLTDELVAVDLVRRYASGNDTFVHVVDFLRLQPAGRNGKRVRRYPHSPWDLEESADIGLIPVNPDESPPVLSQHSDSDSDNHSKPRSTEATGTPAKRSIPASDLSFPNFPVVGGKTTRGGIWVLPADLSKTLANAFPGVNVPAQLREAHSWCVTNPPKRKTAAGMPGFLHRWMGRANDRGGTSRFHEETPREFGERFARENPDGR